MKKNIFNWLMLAAVVGGLSLTLVACSDDDDSNSNAAVDESKEQVMDAAVSDDATVLGSLLREWCDYDADETTADILNQTFAPTVGEVADQSQPLVRTVVVGTQAEADAQAVRMLDILGIDAQQPAGFSWQNSAIGTVSYTHGTGNELGVMTIAVRQVPQLTKLLFVAEGCENVGGEAYYQKGDIVKYKGRYWICMSNHARNTSATWLSFDCGEQINSLPTKTCHWMTVGYDHYYSGDMASPRTLVDWLKDYVVNDEGYDQVVQRMAGKELVEVNQIIPSSQKLRENLLEKIHTLPSTILLDLNTQISNRYLQAAQYYHCVKESEGTFSTTRTIYPVGMLLAGSMRWSMGFTYDYWVPYLVMTPTQNSQEMAYKLNATDSQFGQRSHFQWKKYADNVRYKNANYNIFFVGAHWTHKSSDDDEGTFNNLMSFVGHKRKFEGKIVNLNDENDLDWTLRNITSHELQIKDKGRANTDFETVYCANERIAAKEPKVGWFLGGNGQFYETLQALEAARTTAYGVVVYYDRNKAVEKDSVYNGLVMQHQDYNAMSNPYQINRYEYEYEYLGDDEKYNQCNEPLTFVQAATTLNGLALTTAFINKTCGQNHNHPAAVFAPTKLFNVRTNDNYQFSRWFLPSLGQFVLAAESMTGVKVDPKTGKFNKNLTDLWKWPNGATDLLESNYWTSTSAVSEDNPNLNDQAYVYSCKGIAYKEKDSALKLRLMKAFRVK